MSEKSFAYTYFVRALQCLIGVLFVVSALLKINDPLGLQYKIDEYFDVFGWLSLKSFSFLLAVLMNILEFSVGVALLTGFRMKVVRWVLLCLIIFFTYLTAFAFFSGKLKECGCMGNCIPLTAEFSFYKDLFLLAVSVILFISYRHTYTLWSLSTTRLLFWFSVLLGYLSQMVVYVLLPVWDCMPFQIGRNIPQEMEKYQNTNGRMEMIFTYTKSGKKVSFSSDNFPEDFDSTYTFVERIDKPMVSNLTDKGIAEFSLISLQNQQDVTDSILGEDNITLLMILNESGWDIAEKTIENQKKYFLNTSKILILNSDSKRLQIFFETHQLPMSRAIVVDNVLLKTMCRTPLTSMVLNKGTIADKRGCLFYDQLFEQ